MTNDRMAAWFAGATISLVGPIGLVGPLNQRALGLGFGVVSTAAGAWWLWRAPKGLKAFGVGLLTGGALITVGTALLAIALASSF